MVSGLTIAEWLAKLVRIPSVTPAQAGARAGVPGEARLAGEIVRWCRKLGAEVSVEDVLPGRPSVYAIWKSRSSRWLAIDVHLDTVGVESMEGDPFSGDINDDRVYGRGAVDTKASLAVALALLEELKPQSHALPCNLLLAATADEEDSATGAPALARWIRKHRLRVDEMIVAEPTMCSPVYGHKGVVRMDFDVKGRAAHSSNPQQGRNAISAAAQIVQALEQENARLSRRKSPLGAPTLTVTLINGGTGANVVPPNCLVTIDRRVVPGEMAAKVRAALGKLARQSASLPVSIASSIQIDAFYKSADSALIRRLAKWSARRPAVVPYCTNAWAYSQSARECAVLGPGSIAQAHAAVEWVEIAQLKKLADIYAKWWGVMS